MASIERLTTVDEQALADINALMKQLRSNPADQVPAEMSVLEELLHDKNTVAVAARDGKKIIGFGLLFVLNKMSERIADIHEVIVDVTERGKGLGEKIMLSLIEEARKRAVKEIALTSRPSRDAANNLYKKIGFTQVETNVYRMKL